MIEAGIQLKSIAQQSGMFQMISVMRSFREVVNYPVLYIYNFNTEVIEATTTDLKSYHPDWALRFQIMVKLDNKEAIDDTTGINQIEAITTDFLSLATDTGLFELAGVDYFSGRLAGRDLLISDVQLIYNKELEL